MAADAWQVYDVFLEQLGNELHDLNATDVIKCALLTSSYTPNTDSDVSFSVIDANEVSSGTGYSTGGYTVAATWDATTGTLTFDTANATWTASGGSIVARYAVLYNSSAGGSNDLIAYCLLDNTPADVTATDGNDLNINMNASGIFTIAQS